MRFRRAAAFALAALAATAGPPAASAGDDAPKQAASPSGSNLEADALDRLWREGRTDEFRRTAAAAADIDPFLVLLRLLHVARARGLPFGTSDREMLAAFAASDAAGSLASGIGVATTAWLAATPETLQAEIELNTARERARRADAGAGNAALRERLRALEGPAAANPNSIIGPWIRLQIATLDKQDGGDGTLAIANALVVEAEGRGWPLLEACALDRVADVLHARGRYDEALALRRREAGLRVSVGARADYAAAQAWLSAAALAVGRVDEAADAARTAVSAYMAAGKPEAGLTEKLRLATCAIYGGRLDEAETVAREVQEEAARRGILKVELYASVQVASSLWRRHRVGEALAICETNLPRAEGPDLDAARRMLFMESAKSLQLLKLYDAAAARLGAALDLSMKDRSPSWRAMVLGDLGVIETRRRRFAEGRARLEETVRLFESTGERLRLARAEADLARCCIDQGDTAAALDVAERAFRRTAENSATSIRARTFACRGEARLAAGNAAAAVADLEEAVRIAASATVADSGALLYLREELGRCLIAAGRPSDALPHLREAGEKLLGSSRGLADDESLGLRGNLREIAERGTFAASRLAKSDPARADEAVLAAWWFEEAARARSLGEALAGCGPRRGDAVPEELLAAERDALAGIVRARLDASRAAASGAREKDMAKANAVLDAAYLRLRQNDAKVARTGASSPAAPPRPVELDELRRRIGPDAALVTYSLAGERAFALAVNGSAASLVELGASADLREMAEAWTELASAPDGPEEKLAARLYDALVRPVANVVEGRTRLFVVPDDVLACVPFDALVRRADGRSERVVERWEVVCLPSATVLDLLARETSGRAAGSGVVALGDPTYPAMESAVATSSSPEGPVAMRGVATGLAPLPRSGDEARAVAALYPENERTLLLREHATVREFLDAASPAGAPRRVLHAACHAFVDGDRPGLSGLVFAGGDVLDVETLVRARLSADLAVLSACETAGGALERGEGMIGLTRGFLIAGVPRVVVTAWRVADDTTADLMRAFHERLVRDGESPAAALRAVKLARLKAGGPAAHPYAWAPFMLWGLP